MIRFALALALVAACGVDKPAPVATQSCRSLLAGTDSFPAGYVCPGDSSTMTCYSFDGTHPNVPMVGCYNELHLDDNSPQLTRATCVESCEPKCPDGLVLTAFVCTAHTSLCQERPANGERLGRSVSGCHLDYHTPAGEPYDVLCVAECPGLVVP